jgi:hypothetical protein
LALGASDYVTKPHHTGSVEVTRARIQAELVPKVKVLCTQPHPWTRSAAVTQAWVVGGSASVSRPPQPVGIVAVGTSTGGPNALRNSHPRCRPVFLYPSSWCSICRRSSLECSLTASTSAHNCESMKVLKVTCERRASLCPTLQRVSQEPGKHPFVEGRAGREKTFVGSERNTHAG